MENSISFFRDRYNRFYAISRRFLRLLELGGTQVSETLKCHPVSVKWRRNIRNAVVIGAVGCQPVCKGRSMFLDYTSDVVERLAHVRAHVENEPLLDKLIANINADVPHKNACLLLLSGHVLGKAMVAWFADHNIVEFKNWLFTAAEIDRLSYQAEIDTLAPGGEIFAAL